MQPRGKFGKEISGFREINASGRRGGDKEQG